VPADAKIASIVTICQLEHSGQLLKEFFGSTVRKQLASTKLTKSLNPTSATSREVFLDQNFRPVKRAPTSFQLGFLVALRIEVVRIEDKNPLNFPVFVVHQVSRNRLLVGRIKRYGNAALRPSSGRYAWLLDKYIASWPQDMPHRCQTRTASS